MGGLFSKKSESRVTEHDRAVLQMKQMRDKLKLYQKKITSQLETDRECAKKLIADGRKTRALTLLKKKKFQEKLVSQADGQLTTLEQLISDVEFTQIQHKVLEGMKVGNECLKQMHQIMSLDDVEKIMDEANEGIEYQREIDELISSGPGLDQEDNDAIEAELAAIISQELPEAPKTELIGEPAEGTQITKPKSTKSEAKRSGRVAVEA